MKTMKYLAALMAVGMMIAGEAAANGGYQPPPPSTVPPPTTTTNRPEANAAAEAEARARADAAATAELNARLSQRTSVVANPTATANGGQAVIEEGAVTATGGAGGNAALNVAEGALSPTATGINGDLIVEGSGDSSAAVTGSGNSAIEIGPTKTDIHVETVDKSRSINVVMVPPSIPSLPSAPVLTECTACFMENLVAMLQACGAVSSVSPQVYEGDDFPITNSRGKRVKNVSVKMIPYADFPGLRKIPERVAIAATMAYKMPASGAYGCVASVTVKGVGDDAHNVAVDEVLPRAMQAAEFLRMSKDETLFLVFSSKGVLEHPSLATTGSGWSIAPGAGGPVGSLIATGAGIFGKSRGTATNGLVPEGRMLLIRVKTGGGVTSDGLRKLDADTSTVAATDYKKPGQ